MFIVVTGNVNPTEVITIIKDFESKRDLKEEKKIVRKKYKEPDKVAKKEEKVKMNTSISKVCLAYKINKNLYYIIQYFSLINIHFFQMFCLISYR